MLVETPTKERIFDPSGLVNFLTQEFNYRISEATLRKLRCVGGGPPFFKQGARVAYRESSSRAWVASKSTPEVRSTSELPKRAA